MIEEIREDSPLAVKVRPENLNGFVGQEHILGSGRILKRAIDSKRISSVILWGPAGCGKTSLGLIIAKAIDVDFEYLNAAFSTVALIKKIITKARKRLTEKHEKTVVFIDEVHRFNKLQQESLVPDTELSSIVLIGSTMYNPYYYIIPSLISRSIVSQFKALSKEDIELIVKRAIKNKEKGFGGLNIRITNKALDHISMVCNGDARSALSALELGVLSTVPNGKGEILFDLEVAKESLQNKTLYDRGDSYHYDTISAFIKSVRGSDVDSSLYWLAKMLKSGEDPRFIARRLVILASEDIGNANPFCLVLATNCFKAVEMVGLPESDLILAQTTIYLTTSEKSNSAYLAIKQAEADVEQERIKEIPEHIKTNSKNYKYPHDFKGHLDQDYGVDRRYYFPKNIGDEKKIKQFLEGVCRG